MSSPELVVFQTFASDIADAASGLLSSFPVKLYSKNIIDSKLRNNVTGMTGLGPDQKANLLVNGIEDKLKHAKSDKERKELFELILKVMDDNIPLDSVAEKMREEYQKEVAKPKKEKEKSSREVNDGPGVTDSGQGEVDRPAMMKALNAVGQQLRQDQHSRYHLAVLILMEGDKVATQGGFLQLFQTAQKKLGSYQDAVAFTIAVLERSHFGDTEDLKPFESPSYVLVDSVELFLAINDFYNQMDDKGFSGAKVVVSGSFFNSRDLSELDRSGLVSLLFSEGVIATVDDAVSKIEGFSDSKSYKGFEERRKRSAAERSDTKPPPTGAGNTLLSTNKASSSVPKGSHVNGGGTNKTTDASILKHRVATDSPPVDEATKLPEHKQHGFIEFECDDKFKEIAYKMNKLSRGYCIIINMKKDREEGNKEDIDSLLALFEGTLQFTVGVYDDLTEEQIGALMRNIREADHTQLCCFIMFILAHGGTDKKDGSAYFLTSYGERLKVSSIKHQIAEIDGLNGKPKLLFLQLCRGKRFDQGVEVADEPPSEPEKIPTGSDFLTSFPTIEDYTACRGDKGSRFIQSLCEVFTAHYTMFDVTMMTMVTRKVADMSGPVRRGNNSIVNNVKQNPETTFTFRKTLYFGEPDELTYQCIMRQQ